VVDQVATRAVSAVASTGSGTQPACHAFACYLAFDGFEAEVAVLEDVARTRDDVGTAARVFLGEKRSLIKHDIESRRRNADRGVDTSTWAPTDLSALSRKRIGDRSSIGARSPMPLRTPGASGPS